MNIMSFIIVGYVLTIYWAFKTSRNVIVYLIGRADVIN